MLLPDTGAGWTPTLDRDTHHSQEKEEAVNGSTMIDNMDFNKPFKRHNFRNVQMSPNSDGLYEIRDWSILIQIDTLPQAWRRALNTRPLCLIWPFLTHKSRLASL